MSKEYKIEVKIIRLFTFQIKADSDIEAAEKAREMAESDSYSPDDIYAEAKILKKNHNRK